MRRALHAAVFGAVVMGCNNVPSAPAPPSAQTPAEVAAVAGNGQTAPIGSAVPIRPAVRVTDAAGSPVGGVSVSFSVTAGGGSVAGSPATTDANGLATVGNWTLGNSVGSNALSAQVAALPAVTFTATAISGFDIELRYLTAATTTQRQAFDDAVARWQSLVIGDLLDQPLTRPAGSCGSNSPAIDETVDDLLILVTLEPIDGPNGVLGVAGPCVVRVPSNLPVLGQMRFDTDDLALLETTGSLSTVVLHEMGHVLGIGTLWELNGLLADASESGGTEPHFTGALAISAFDDVGGASYTGAKVPVEDTGGPGTADGHWRESVMDRELMTGYLDVGQNPLSIVTVASLDDQGYTVSTGGADAFSVAGAGVATAHPGRMAITLLNDVWMGTLHGIDPAGRIRVVRP